MKRSIRRLAWLLVLLLLFAGCEATIPTEQPPIVCSHTDADDNGICDTCVESVLVSIDFYAVNDLHGKFKDTEENAGVDELSSYFRLRQKEDDHVVLLSSGDMWQGSSESNLTKGKIITDWMNDLQFSAMTLGNHEYDWGEEFIKANSSVAAFPFLAINVYDRDTHARVDYCQASTMVERGGIQIGIIGAIGDCYSSISGDKSEGFYIKTGDELTALVRQESLRLRAAGADLIVYSVHDGYEKSVSGKKQVSAGDLSGYYDTALSNGCVDLVFEGHTHQKYVLVDEYGVHHLQNGGENKGISHAEVRINSVTGTSRVNEAQFVATSVYSKLSDDPIVMKLLKKYEAEIAIGDVVLGRNDAKLRSDALRQLVAKLYYERGIDTWGEEYDIVLGGGYLSTRSPYDLAAGEIKYSHLQAILPFDNALVLCSIKGADLQSRFLESDNSSYFIHCGDYGEEIRNEIDPNAVYYLVTDTYTSTYAPNRLTEIERLSGEIYARDLVADYIRAGGLTSKK